MQTLTSSLSDQSQQLSPDHVISRPRRASMYDALDLTKIDASLYQRPVHHRRILPILNIWAAIFNDYLKD